MSSHYRSGLVRSRAASSPAARGDGSGEASQEIEGLVLCRVGDHHIAFPAAAVGSIDHWEPGGVPAPQARVAFGLPVVAGKLLVRGGFSLVVDALEIVADPAKLMPVPAMLLGAVGGALRGFVQLAGALVPLLGLAEFSKFVTRGPA